MKKFEKILLWILALLVIAAIICIGLYFSEQKKITAYSAACMDQVRAEVGEELSDIVYLLADKIEGKYVYGGSFSSQGTDYEFVCVASNPDDIQVQVGSLDDFGEITYDADSWKELIDENCQTFFDGCNQCSRLENGEVACTKMFCEQYQQPVCTDNNSPTPDKEITNLGANTYMIIGPDYGFNEQIDQGTLVLRADYVDHVDYVFLPAGTWEDSLNPITYRTNVIFDGSVRFVDGAAGSHYYQAENIDQLSYQE